MHVHATEDGKDVGDGVQLHRIAERMKYIPPKGFCANPAARLGLWLVLKHISAKKTLKTKEHY